ncbi:Phosphatidylinositol transfer protein [Cynara cardunculus var. scolymus]|uniref:Phosphatidylinositol transfer protein n=1 Tax=Cynara cardunculus var. scolymus TaxID=59895 RepID=A0A103YF13_CYNCS|nr:Phosphatidylinositol transfer protein [Cynara cardunculus var. scolymus]
MVLIKEFRIVMPLSLEEVAQMYMVMKMQQQNTSSTEGVDVLENRNFEDGLFGKGRYTSKVYRLQRLLLGLVVLRQPMLSRCKRKLGTHTRDAKQCPYFTSFTLTIETIHRADNGHSENVHGLNKQQLADREVEIIDIASTSDDYWSYVIGSNTVDFSKFQSSRTARGPLLEGWQDHCKPVMTAYKLVTVDAPYWGFGSRLEQALIAGERALFLESHRNCFAWIDEWHGMTVKMMCDIEKQSIPLSHEESLSSPF